MPDDFVRATMIARLNSLSKAKSGVHPSVIEVLTTLINKEIYPVILEHGGVGASGDLVQLAHLALVLIGEGEVIFKNKDRKSTRLNSSHVRISYAVFCLKKKKYK